MPLNIGTKVYRNMQEQVGYLTGLVNELKIIIKNKEYSIKDIRQEEGHLIFELNDGEIIDAGAIKSIDSVEINASSHLIITYNDETTADVGLIKSIVSVTKNSSGHIIVAYSDGTTADLGLVKGIDHFVLDANYHLIAYYDNNTSEDIGVMVNIDFSSLDLVVKTVSQTQANNVFTLSLSTIPTSLTVETVYTRTEVINNVLYVIINLKITNNTASTFTRFAGESFLFGYFFASAVASQVIDFDGKSLAEASSAVFTVDNAYRFGGITSGIKTDKIMISNTSTPSQGRVDIYAGDTNFSLQPTETTNITCRLALTLL